jgi:hypothetical protein
MATLSREFLEKRVAELNEWLRQHMSGLHLEYAQKKQARDYYVRRLIEIEESGNDTVEVQDYKLTNK